MLIFKLLQYTIGFGSELLISFIFSFFLLFIFNSVEIGILFFLICIGLFILFEYNLVYNLSLKILLYISLPFFLSYLLFLQLLFFELNLFVQEIVFICALLLNIFFLLIKFSEIIFHFI